MKNYIPLVLAVLLGLAAVLAVGRVLRERQKKAEDTIFVTVASRNIKIDETLTLDALRDHEIPVSARPNQAVSWSRKELIIGQKALKPVAEGDYLLLSDVGLSRSVGTIVGKGEWAVSLNVGAGGVMSVLQPGDEVALIGSMNVRSTTVSVDLSAAPKETAREVTTVLFPRVRVLDISGAASGELLLGLPPAQAQFLIAAQQRVKISVALRRPGDDTMLNRSEIGVVDNSTFEKLLNDMTACVVPDGAGAGELPKVETPKK